jgi:hypothetical protein
MIFRQKRNKIKLIFRQSKKEKKNRAKQEENKSFFFFHVYISTKDGRLQIKARFCSLYGNSISGKDCVKLKGPRCGIIGILWRTLKRREAMVILW